MTHLTQQVKQGAGQALASLSQGWHELKDRASGALTRFRLSGETRDRADERQLPAVGSWAFMAADVVERDDTVIVRLEAPGLRRSDFRIEVRGETLWVQGEKRIERELEEGGWYSIESAYGAFERAVPLPAVVDAGKARASYTDGVLRVELPKVEGAAAKRYAINVH